VYSMICQIHLIAIVEPFSWIYLEVSIFFLIMEVSNDQSLLTISSYIIVDGKKRRIPLHLGLYLLAIYYYLP